MHNKMKKEMASNLNDRLKIILNAHKCTLNLNVNKN